MGNQCCAEARDGKPTGTRKVGSVPPASQMGSKVYQMSSRGSIGRSSDGFIADPKLVAANDDTGFAINPELYSVTTTGSAPNLKKSQKQGSQGESGMMAIDPMIYSSATSGGGQPLPATDMMEREQGSAAEFSPSTTASSGVMNMSYAGRKGSGKKGKQGEKGKRGSKGKGGKGRKKSPGEV
mmetsp:Transcript_4998/g.12549  ORF Transcript_4998/g.12549 Transcript_4998/m.12549 type:complete len:182 (-) Transcript_4998:781-1326(-)|eukprot:CAMPEP_0178983280 /NCGR_PEP_ID=MMETSP0795-20121207/969_1 /TAXON_ID=88552 /ORGANISM="Amoebophrya sp., Strain Ameob2" /LENGTH=181 /DNA_ID=CAMNT_0020674029 /DNA_START=97 /DNA_END=642 /DNA_ORIENTATION=-